MTDKLIIDNRTGRTLAEIVARLEKTCRCNCDLDNWVPELTTGHSWVCRIHRFATEEFKRGRNDQQ